MRDASCTRERRSPTVSVLQYAQGHDSRGLTAEQPVIVSLIISPHTTAVYACTESISDA